MRKTNSSTIQPNVTLFRISHGRFGALKSDSTHHFFRNACTKSGSCWLILSVYILMSFPFVRLFSNFVITLISTENYQFLLLSSSRKKLHLLLYHFFLQNGRIRTMQTITVPNTVDVDVVLHKQQPVWVNCMADDKTLQIFGDSKGQITNRKTTTVRVK